MIIQGVITGPYIMQKINRMRQHMAMLLSTTEVGQHQMWAAQYYKYKAPRQLP